MSKALVKAPAINREAWLTKAIAPLAALIAEKTELAVPKDHALQASCGWPGSKSINKVIGQCWPSGMTNGVIQCFISPKLTDPVQILEVLLHELIHAADDCQHGHKGAFVKAARTVGLAGKPTATYAEPGSELHKALKAIAKDLGTYPHKGITPGARLLKPQTTRMIKVACTNKRCGCIVRMTRVWLNSTGAPTCACGAKMKEVS